ncbi:aromatic acid exporter family protein [Evansella sp. AB-P1]|uniref:FUSC family protein n=1 Tax=Evansella sp. AB-P1 TaxID=3037653 RepID=UPI00241BF0A9|nr:aromatic acid exporter family protein [Evansella sp. AB-P1]MDG5789653.1 aromatic acid exporter family protein [Evansella sp. AB-P1]
MFNSLLALEFTCCNCDTTDVTLEPTAYDSIRKGVIRLPASAIGAALAVFFVSILGETALTFALAATLTIIICQKFKLHHGTLVATLTAVAMIPNIHDHFFIAFLTRLGTTTIGLTVSTLVNLLLFPPKYVSTIENQIISQIALIQKVLFETMKYCTNSTEKSVKNLPLQSYKALRRHTEKTEDIIFYQEMEWKYHRINHKEYKHFKELKAKLQIIQKANLHLGNLQYIETPVDLTTYERELLLKATNLIIYTLDHLKDPITDDYFYTINELDQYLKYSYSSNNLKDPKYIHHFQVKTVIFYELLSIHDCLEELQQLTKK